MKKKEKKKKKMKKKEMMKKKNTTYRTRAATATVALEEEKKNESTEAAVAAHESMDVNEDARVEKRRLMHIRTVHVLLSSSSSSSSSSLPSSLPYITTTIYDIIHVYVNLRNHISIYFKKYIIHTVLRCLYLKYRFKTYK